MLDSEKTKKTSLNLYERPYLGTVGAIALDKNGNLAAATSTGGMTNKMTGRIGDSPIIGSGTYADNDSVAVSCHWYRRYLHACKCCSWCLSSL